MDQMFGLTFCKYVLSGLKKINIKPVDIDFPLPKQWIGSENRLNSPTQFKLPKQCSFKHKPEFSVGKQVSLQHLFDHSEDYIGKVVSVVGWAREARLQQKDTLLFVKLIDGSNAQPLQVVVESTVENWEELKKAKMGYSFRFKGMIEKSIGKGQSVELKLKGEKFEEAFIFGKCDDDKYPLSGAKIKLQTLRDIAHLRPRTQIINAVTRVKNSIAHATHQFFQNNGFNYIHTPLITAADCEGAGEMFQVTTILPQSGKIADIPQSGGNIDYSKEFFKKSANLTVSGQLAVENYCCALGNVYTFGPTFRAEVSHTSRHIAQFWMIEPQLAFADIYDTMECAEAYMHFSIHFILCNNIEDLKFLQTKKPGLIQYLKGLIDQPFAKASYSQAIAILQKIENKGVVFQKDVYWGMDLGSQHERYLCDHVFKRPVIIYNYPKEIKAFYMRANADGRTVAAFDILAPEVGQIVGGSQREERLSILEARIEQVGLPKENYWWYLDLRRHGTMPHGGFGLGFERLVMMATGIENIRDISSFPRTPGNCDF